MIRCREVVELLCDFLGDELTVEQRRDVELHLCQCQKCVIYIETFRLTIRLSRCLEDKPLPSSLAEKLRAICDEKLKQANQGEFGADSGR